MAFRERIEWLTLTAMALAYGVYFSLVATYAAGPSLIETLWLFAKVQVAHLVVVIAGSIILALLFKSEAQAKSDERDRAIDRRSAAAAYYVLLTGVIIVGLVMPFQDPPPAKIINASLLILILSEAVRHIIKLLSYRRGWNG